MIHVFSRWEEPKENPLVHKDNMQIAHKQDTLPLCSPQTQTVEY